ncbi:hypothetical protein ACFZAM_03005 [Streptomyces sp. NPDC008079]|uniref:hypothetical protein n=1 Tax=Streptomyces sp. NPDC008079 TaxID=3364806 RepID=UPI0036ECA633
MKHIVLGVLLGLCGAFPHLAQQGAAPLGTAALWATAQPVVWLLLAAAVARPRHVRRLFRSLR